MALETVYAIHSFSAEKGDEISFELGEPILVFEKDEMYGDGWWQGKNVRGEIGLFPMNYTSYSKPLPPSPKIYRHNKLTNNNNKSNNSSRNYNSNLNRNSKRDSINFNNYRIPLASQYNYHSIDGMIDDIQSKSDETSLDNLKEEKDEQLLLFQSRNNNQSNDESQFLSYNSDNSYNNNYNYNNNNKKLSQNTSSSSASSYSSHLSSSTKGTSSIYSQNQLQSFQQQQIDDNNNNNKINILALATTKTTTITTYNNEKLKSHPTTWNVENVCSWLHEKGFDSVTQKNFRDNDITGDILLDLNTDILKELNIASFGKRVHIMNAITALKSEFSINDKNKEDEKDDSSEYEEQVFVDQKPSSRRLGNRKYSISNPSLSKYPDNEDTNITHEGFQNGSQRPSTAVKFSNDTKKVSYPHQATLQKSGSNFSNKENNDEKNNKSQRSIFSKMSQLTKPNNNKKTQKSLSMFSPQKKTDKPRTISTGGWEFKDEKDFLDSSDDNNNNKNKSNSNNGKLSRSRFISSDINNNNGNNNEKKSFKYLPNFNNNNKPKKSAMDKNALFAGGVSISQPNSPRRDKFNNMIVK